MSLDKKQKRLEKKQTKLQKKLEKFERKGKDKKVDKMDIKLDKVDAKLNDIEKDLGTVAKEVVEDESEKLDEKVENIDKDLLELWLPAAYHAEAKNRIAAWSAYAYAEWQGRMLLINRGNTNVYESTFITGLPKAKKRSSWAKKVSWSIGDIKTNTQAIFDVVLSELPTGVAQDNVRNQRKILEKQIYAGQDPSTVLKKIQFKNTTDVLKKIEKELRAVKSAQKKLNNVKQDITWAYVWKVPDLYNTADVSYIIRQQDAQLKSKTTKLSDWLADRTDTYGLPIFNFDGTVNKDNADYARANKRNGGVYANTWESYARTLNTNVLMTPQINNDVNTSSEYTAELVRWYNEALAMPASDMRETTIAGMASMIGTRVLKYPESVEDMLSSGLSAEDIHRCIDVWYVWKQDPKSKTMFAKTLNDNLKNNDLKEAYRNNSLLWQNGTDDKEKGMIMCMYFKTFESQYGIPFANVRSVYEKLYPREWDGIAEQLDVTSWLDGIDGAFWWRVVDNIRENGLIWAPLEYLMGKSKMTNQQKMRWRGLTQLAVVWFALYKVVWQWIIKWELKIWWKEAKRWHVLAGIVWLEFASNVFTWEGIMQVAKALTVWDPATMDKMMWAWSMFGLWKKQKEATKEQYAMAKADADLAVMMQSSMVTWWVLGKMKVSEVKKYLKKNSEGRYEFDLSKKEKLIQAQWENSLAAVFLRENDKNVAKWINEWLKDLNLDEIDDESLWSVMHKRLQENAEHRQFIEDNQESIDKYTSQLAPYTLDADVWKKFNDQAEHAVTEAKIKEVVTLGNYLDPSLFDHLGLENDALTSFKKWLDKTKVQDLCSQYILWEIATFDDLKEKIVAWVENEDAKKKAEELLEWGDVFEEAISSVFSKLAKKVQDQIEERGGLNSDLTAKRWDLKVEVDKWVTVLRSYGGMQTTIDMHANKVAYKDTYLDIAFNSPEEVIKVANLINMAQYVFAHKIEENWISSNDWPFSKTWDLKIDGLNPLNWIKKWLQVEVKHWRSNLVKVTLLSEDSAHWISSKFENDNNQDKLVVFLKKIYSDEWAFA